MVQRTNIFFCQKGCDESQQLRFFWGRHRWWFWLPLTHFSWWKIANNSDFLAAAQRYPQDVFITGEVLRFTPSALAPLGAFYEPLRAHLTDTRTVAYLCTGGHSATRILVEHLTTKVRSRLETRGQDWKKSVRHFYNWLGNSNAPLTKLSRTACNGL